FREGEFRGNLVGGDAERVQATGDVAGFKDDDVVAFLPQFVCASEAGRTGTDDGDPLAAGRVRLEETHLLGGRRVAGMALQTADLDRRLHQQVVDASAFAKDFRGTGPGATASQDVRFKNCFGRPEGVLVQELSDEFGDVDVRRAGPRTR